MRGLLPIGIISTLIALPAYAGVYTYAVDFYPLSAGENCHALAQQIGEQVKSAGLNVVRSVCKEQRKNDIDVAVYYDAESKADIVSTVRNFGAFDPETYPTKDACLAALPGERALFVEQTGLEPAVAYCYIDANYGRLWGARLEAFGNPEVKPFITGNYAFGTILAYSALTFKEAIRTNLAAHGIVVRTVGLKSSMAMLEVAIGYYGRQQLRLEIERFAEFKEQAHCEAALPVMQAVVEQTRAKTAILYCGAERINGRYEATIANMGAMPFIIENSIEAFPDYEACESEREGLIEFYRTQLKQDVFAGLCHIPNGQQNYRVSMLKALLN